MPWYKTGTVTLTNGSAEVVGSGTTWGDGTIAPGDSFSLVDTNGAAVEPHYEVAEVADDTHLMLTVPYGGASASGVKYALWNLAAEHTTPYLSSLVAALVQKFKTVSSDIIGYVTRAETAADNAETSETNAADSATAASDSATDAAAAKDDAVDAKTAAESAKTAAETAKGQAETAATNASGYADAASDSADAAAESASQAASSAASMTPATSTPLADSAEGSVGTSTAYARADHQHPRDTSIPSPSSSTPLGTSENGTVGTSNDYARADHQHPKESGGSGIHVYVDGETDETILAETVDGDIIFRKVTVTTDDDAGTGDTTE